MGLFKKTPTVQPTDFLALRAEVVELRARLEAAEQEKAQLVDRIASLDASTTALAASHPDLSNLDDIRHQVDQVSARLGDVSNEVRDVRTQLGDVAGQVGSVAGQVGDVSSQVTDVSSRVETLQQQATRVAESVPPPPPPPPAAPAGPDPEVAAQLEELGQRFAAVDTLQQQLGQLTARVAAQAEMGAQLSSLRDRLTQIQEQVGQTDALRDQVQQLAQRSRTSDEFGALMQQLSERLDRTEQAHQQHDDRTVALVDERVAATVQPHIDDVRQHVEERLSSMGTELANQISELGRDLDALHAAPRGAGDSIDVQALVEELRTGQVRLANEQARYEIAFRADLAELAERCRRSA